MFSEPINLFHYFNYKGVNLSGHFFIHLFRFNQRSDLTNFNLKNILKHEKKVLKYNKWFVWKKLLGIRAKYIPRVADHLYKQHTKISLYYVNKIKKFYKVTFSLFGSSSTYQLTNKISYQLIIRQVWYQKSDGARY